MDTCVAGVFFFFQYKMQDALYLLNLCLRQQFRASTFPQRCPNSLLPGIYFFLQMKLF